MNYHCTRAGVIALLGLSTFVIPLPGNAHHGTAVSYEQDNWITVSGTVTEFRWRNPHSALFLNTSSTSGETALYTIELPSPLLMSRSTGWNRESFKPGDLVEFRVHPSISGAPVGECLNSCLVFVNGEQLQDNTLTTP